MAVDWILNLSCRPKETLGGGDIDHVVLGPNGIFVLETKNWIGPITCNGDLWQRSGKQNFKGSPSRQVKRNASTIKHIIDSSSVFRSYSIDVEGIVVVILYPKGKVSKVQELQLTTLGGNVTTLELHGNFDDCQALAG